MTDVNSFFTPEAQRRSLNGFYFSLNFSVSLCLCGNIFLTEN